MQHVLHEQVYCARWQAISNLQQLGYEQLRLPTLCKRLVKRCLRNACRHEGAETRFAFACISLAGCVMPGISSKREASSHAQLVHSEKRAKHMYG